MELCRTILDEAGDMKPETAEKLGYNGLAHVKARERPLASKRAVETFGAGGWDGGIEH